MGSPWTKHHNPCAVVPPVDAFLSRDILDASSDLAFRSPSCFGLGVSRVSKVPNLSGPYPLYYVSPHAAKDRHLSDVEAGWYVAAEPGEEFEVCISMLPGDDSNQRILPSNGSLITRLSVDGSRACNYMVPPGFVHDIIVRGYVISRSVSPLTRRVFETCRKFIFCKTEVKKLRKNKLSCSGCGEIQLQLLSPQFGGPSSRNPPMRTFDLSGRSDVDERTAVQKGVSVGVSREGELVPHVAEASKLKVASETLIPSATITIHMRELYWLKSRRIIDEEGYPVKFVEEKVVVMPEPRRYVIDEVILFEEPIRKRQKREIR